MSVTAEEVLASPFVESAAEFAAQEPESSIKTDEISEPHVGKWNILVSQTNWEKGTLILEWRLDLIAAGMPNSVYSDEAWARRVGNVSAQHIGRLRRVAERFGKTHTKFPGLFWSHFYAVLEWDDAELWLEGAVQNGWSVAQMRVQRWETIGPHDDARPNESGVFTTEIDDDAYVFQQQDRIEGRDAEINPADITEGFNASALAVSETANEPVKKKESPKKSKPRQPLPEGASEGELLNTLKAVAEFPNDLAEPIEQLKIAVLNHKLAGWKEVPAENVCRSLDALRLLAVAE
ncbi:MAG: hypothetical protein LBH00_06580 [Planctomycetaceae bacterium]|jgi:hypothetical protein|nr:hypothetical protein [Planctomycetaceae bacterium]